MTWSVEEERSECRERQHPKYLWIQTDYSKWLHLEYRGTGPPTSVKNNVNDPRLGRDCRLGES